METTIVAMVVSILKILDTRTPKPYTIEIIYNK